MLLAEDWREMFHPWILKRGRNYWMEGRVTDLHKNGNEITAIVQGTEDYEVSIDIEDGEATHFHCSCPYAMNDTACKHMAAVLFALEKADIEEQPASDSEKRISWQEAVSQMPEGELRAFLMELASKDARIQERLVLRHTKQLPKNQMKEWKEELRNLAHNSSDSDGFIDYDDAYDFCTEVDAFLKDTASELMDAGMVLDAFHLICMTYELIIEQDMDDSDGGLSIVLETCESLWREAIKEGNSSEKEEMYQALRASPTGDFESIWNTLFTGAWEQRQLEQNLALLDSLIAGDPSDYRIEQFFQWRLDTMEALHMAPDEMRSYTKRFRYLPIVRRKEIQQSVDEQNYQQAIDLLRESKTIDQDNRALVSRYSEQLVELYEKTGQTELSREELRFLIFSCGENELTYVKKLKEITSQEEWPALFEEILRLPAMRYSALDLLALDGQYERLFQALKKAARLNTLDRYENALKPWSAEKVRDLYMELLQAEMASASSRRAYWYLIHYLSKLNTYPDGAAAARSLCGAWKAAYPRRTAMLDELKKAGF